jgi:hypothetical protein
MVSDSQHVLEEILEVNPIQRVEPARTTKAGARKPVSKTSVMPSRSSVRVITEKEEKRDTSAKKRRSKYITV